MLSRIVDPSELSEGQLPLIEKAEKYVLVRGSVVNSATQGLSIRVDLGTIFTINEEARFIYCSLITHQRIGGWRFMKAEVTEDTKSAVMEMLSDWNRQGTNYRGGKMVLVYFGTTQYQQLPHPIGYLHPQFMQLLTALHYELLGKASGSDEPEVAEGCRALADRFEGVIRDQWRHLTDHGVKPLFT